MKKIIISMAVLVVLTLCTACGKNGGEMTYGKIEKLGDGLYEVTYNEYEKDHEKISKIIDEKFKGLSAGCTSIYKDGMLIRNLDWYIHENGEDVCELVVHTTANEGRYATVGVVNNPLITDERVGKLTDDQKKIIPYIINDGINSEGLMFSQNVCPEIDGISNTTGTNPDGDNLCNYMLGRQLLDHCANVDEAITFLEKSNVYMKDNGDETSMESHFLIADKNRAIVVEFIDNKMVVLEQEDLPYDEMFITNHYLFNGGENTGHGMGYRRDKIVQDNYASITDWESGMAVLEKLKYTQAYTLPLGDDFWYDEYYVKTEFEGKDADFNCNTANDDPVFLRFIESKQEAYKTTGDGCWWTNHSSVYDTDDGSLHLVVREHFDNVYTFAVEK